MPSPEVMETGFQLTKARSCQKIFCLVHLLLLLNTKSLLEKINRVGGKKSCITFWDIRGPLDCLVHWIFYLTCQSTTEAELLNDWVPHTYVISYWALLLSWYLLHDMIFLSALHLEKEVQCCGEFKIGSHCREDFITNISALKVHSNSLSYITGIFCIFLGSKYWSLENEQHLE